MDSHDAISNDGGRAGSVVGSPITHLRPFDRSLAATVAGWVTDDREVFWLAPKTSPPLTTEKVIAWTNERDYPRLIYLNDDSEPVGYGELHHMPRSTTHLWLGHLLVAPGHRGRGFGVQLTARLLTEAFTRFHAKRVSLVVFPENKIALRCYGRAGLMQIGEQIKFFETTGEHHRMIAMSIDRSRFRRTYRPPRHGDTGVG